MNKMTDNIGGDKEHHEFQKAISHRLSNLILQKKNLEDELQQVTEMIETLSHARESGGGADYFDLVISFLNEAEHGLFENMRRKN